MDTAEFEQDILKLAFETDVRITTASVAYYLGVPSSEAEPMLEEMLEHGILELDSDEEGHLYYRVADAAARNARQMSEPRDEASAVEGQPEASTAGGVESGGGASPQDGPELSEPVGSATVDGEDDVEAFDPTSQPDAHPGSDGHAERASASAGNGRVDPPDEGPRVTGGTTPATAARAEQTSANGIGHAAAVESQHTDSAVPGVTRRTAATDARVDRCGDERLVVQAEAECEPKPFAESDPVIASCAEPTEQSSSADLVPADEASSQMERADAARARGASEGEAAAKPAMYANEGHIQKPEHQPGMSLLLSLILCGTGQIYNGEVSKGIMMMVLCFLLWFVLLGWVVHIWSIVDSVVVAERINRQSNGN